MAASEVVVDDHIDSQRAALARPRLEHWLTDIKTLLTAWLSKGLRLSGLMGLKPRLQLRSRKARLLSPRAHTSAVTTRVPADSPCSGRTGC